MEFDKSKILTVVTADQAKVGQKGWFGDTPRELETKFRTKKPYTINELKENVLFPFEASYGPTSALFYPAPEPTYAERQTEWVKENNVAIGTKVRITRAFSDFEDGIAQQWNESMGATVGRVGVVDRLLGIMRNEGSTKGIQVDFGDCQWWYPYTVLEIIKEPTYRPYNNDELNDLVGEVLTNKKSGRRKLVTGKPTEALGVNLDGSYITAKDLLFSFYRNTNEPCGIKEAKHGV